MGLDVNEVEEHHVDTELSSKPSLQRSSKGNSWLMDKLFIRTFVTSRHFSHVRAEVSADKRGGPCAVLEANLVFKNGTIIFVMTSFAADLAGSMRDVASTKEFNFACTASRAGT